jgi:hypothetical protein
MAGGGIVFIFIVIVLLIIAGAIYSAIAARKRREALFEFATRLGLAFSPGNDYELADRFSFLDTLARGSNRYAFNVLSGSYRQNEVLVFDYHFETHSTDSRTPDIGGLRMSAFFLRTPPEWRSADAAGSLGRWFWSD